MKILFNTDKRTIKEGRPSRLDKTKSAREKEIDIVSMLAVATVANARRFYDSVEAQRIFAKIIHATVLKELGDNSLMEETKTALKSELSAREDAQNEVQM